MDYNWLHEIGTFQVNRLENKAYKHQYRTEEERLAKKTSFKRSLNGTWKFEYATSVADCNKEFYQADYDCSGWDNIQVPGHFSLQGYGQAFYLNHVYTWSGGAEELLPGQVPQVNDVGSYVTEFDLSENDVQEKVEICFDGVESAFALWVNGKFIGYSEDSYGQSYFDLSDAVRVGRNKLAVQVFRFCSGSWIEGQDYFRLCGIFRDVELVFIPKTHLLDLTVLTPLFDDYTRANVEVSCEFEGKLDEAKAVFRLLDKERKLIAVEEKELWEKKNPLNNLIETAIKSDDNQSDIVAEMVLQNGDDQSTVTSETLCRNQISVSFPINKPDLWSSEHPDLYTLLVEVVADGQTLEITEQRVGVREFKIVGNIMYINGRRIVFHGVNRHEFCARTGRVVSYEDTLYDIQTMKANNINALRTSHYPNFEYVYDLCDEYGLYCCDEANVESHGSWNDWWDMDHAIPHNKMEWYPPVIDRANSMYQRDKNHASIVIWSIGNESYGGRVLYEESEFLRKIDPSRVVQYESLEYEEMHTGTREYPGTSDVESQMYIPAAKIEKFLKERPGKPYILCEYSHSMGNSNGGLFKYTELEKKYPEYQGGFLWDWVDQGQYDKDGVIRYGGDLRERPSDYEFCGNGLLFADRTVSPKMSEVKYCFQYVDMAIDPEKIRITNNYLFTNLSSFLITLELNKNGRTMERKDLRVTCEPLESCEIENPFAVNGGGAESAKTANAAAVNGGAAVWQENGTLSEAACGEDQYDVIMRVFDEKNHEVAHQQYIYERKQEDEAAGWQFACGKDAEADDCQNADDGSIPQPKNDDCKKSQTEVSIPMRYSEDFLNIGIKAGDYHIIFAKNKGLVCYKVKGEQMIRKAPKPNFFRARTNNDANNGYGSRYGLWLLASLYPDIRFVKIEKGETLCRIWYEYRLPNLGEEKVKVLYTITGDGTIRVDMDYMPDANQIEMPAFGMMFSFYKEYDHVNYFGFGPDENHIDRNKGSLLGWYEYDVPKNVTPYQVPQECGNRTNTQVVSLSAVSAGSEPAHRMTFTSAGFEFSALPCTPFELENAEHQDELPGYYQTTLCLYSRQMGVGGDDSWGLRTLDEFLLSNKEKQHLHFSFRGE